MRSDKHLRKQNTIMDIDENDQKVGAYMYLNTTKRSLVSIESCKSYGYATGTLRVHYESFILRFFGSLNGEIRKKPTKRERSNENSRNVADSWTHMCPNTLQKSLKSLISIKSTGHANITRQMHHENITLRFFWFRVYFAAMSCAHDIIWETQLL